MHGIAVSSPSQNMPPSVPWVFPPSTEPEPREHRLPSFLERPRRVSPCKHSSACLFPVCFRAVAISISNSAVTAESTRGLGFSGDCQIALQRGRMDLHSHWRCVSPSACFSSSPSVLSDFLISAHRGALRGFNFHFPER